MNYLTLFSQRRALSFKLSLFISSARYATAFPSHVMYPSAEMGRVYARARMYVHACVCARVCKHRVRGNVVFKGGDCSGPCGLQADKVMMAPAFSASSSQSD